MRHLTILVVIGLICAMPAFVQDVGECDIAGIGAAIQAELDEMAEDPVAALSAIIGLAWEGIFGCAEEPALFSGDPGAQPVLGPLPLHEGYYIFTMTTDGGARIDAKALEACGKDLDGTLFNFSAGAAVRGAETLVQAEEDCPVYLEFSKITAGWTLALERLR